MSDDTIVFVPLKGNAKVKKAGSTQEMSFHKRFGKAIASAESDSYLSMIKTDKTPHKFPKSRSSIALTKGQTVVRNGATPEGFSPKEFKVSCGTLSALINHLTSDCGMSICTLRYKDMN